MTKKRWTSLTASLIVLVGCVYLFNYVQRPPSRDDAAANMTFGGELFAYEVLHGTPHVAFRFPNGGKLIVDHLRLDWISIEFPPKPAWQLTGNWTGTANTSAPASVAVSHCTGGRCQGDTELFGQIDASEIVAVEVLYDGRWHRYPVAVPGYIVRLDGYRGTPEEYRWLDVTGEVVYAVGH